MMSFYIIFIFLVELSLSNLFKFIVISSEEEIKIKVQGPGSVQIIRSDFNNLPDKVYSLNGKLIGEKISLINTSKNEETIIMEWNVKLTSLEKMFYKLTDILEIDFSEFDTNNVNDMNRLFEGCTALKQINFNNFKTSNVESWYCMFKECSSLTSLDLSSFRTTNNKNFGSLFTGCNSLTSIDLTSFDTSSVTHIDNMFKDCALLTSLNLSSFKTIKVDQAQDMFNNCKSLVYLDLSNFDTSSLKQFENMFSGCVNLKYLNLLNVKEKQGFNFNNIFYGIPKNIIICINEVTAPNLYKEILKKSCPIKACLQELNNKEINALVNSDSCTIYHYTFDNNNCYYDCEQNYFQNNNNFPNKHCIYNIRKCLICSIDSLMNNNLCSSCNNHEGFYPLEDKLNNQENFVDCYESKIGYFLDINQNLLKPCYFSCERCEQEGNDTYHYCLECKNDYIERNNEFYSELNLKKYKNCYVICPYYYYYDIDKNKKICTDHPQCPANYDKIIRTEKQCVHNCTKYINNQYEFRKECFKECPSGSMILVNQSYINQFQNFDKNYYCEVICNEEKPFEKISEQECTNNCSLKDISSKICIIKFENPEKKENNIKVQDAFLDNIENGLTSDDYNTSILDKGEDELIQIEKITITLTTTDNQKKMKIKI